VDNKLITDIQNAFKQMETDQKEILKWANRATQIQNRIVRGIAFINTNPDIWPPTELAVLMGILADKNHE